MRGGTRFGCASQQVERVVGVLGRVELAVGLVEDHRDVARDRRTNAVIRSNGGAVDVGLFGLQTRTSRVAAVISSSIAPRS